jgi:hypothetical protein
MKRIFFFLLVTIFSVQSWAQSSHCLADRYAQDALFDSTDIQITSNIHYATSMRWPGTQMDSLWMDVYQPNPSIDPLEKRPLIVMTHGGSFAAGTRNAMAYQCMEMARRGFVTATISYRLGWNCSLALDPCIICQGEAGKLKVATYHAVQDHRAALRHLVHNAADFGIDTSYIFVQGESAGSITSLNSVFWDQAEASDWCANCVDFVGELDTAGNNLTDNYTIKGVVNNCGAVSNLDVMDGHTTPVISFHNDPDCVVNYNTAPVINCVGCEVFYWAAGSNSIQTRLNSNGVCTQRHTILEVNHCTYYANPLIKKSACFLKGIMCDDCSAENTINDFSIPDCSSGGFVGIEEDNEGNTVRLNGNRLVFQANSNARSVQVFDVSMRLLTTLSVNSSIVELPTNLTGCMFVKIDSENRSTEMLRWCNF